jgi:hypothetical protein
MNLNNSNARKAIQAALVSKPRGMVAMTTILRIGRPSNPDTMPGSIAVGGTLRPPSFRPSILDVSR